MSALELHCGDCLELMRALPANSVDLIATDPPYYKVKGEAWDNQWTTPAAFLAWFDLLAEQWQRVLRPNGSLYVCASPRMAARVEVLLDERFNVLNSIVWDKSAEPTGALRYGDDRFRKYIQKSERLIFAEHKGADNMAKGGPDGDGYEAACDSLRAQVFAPLREYLATEAKRAGHTKRSVDLAFCQKTGNAKSGMAGHWFGVAQWALPTETNYLWLRGVLGAGYLERDHAELRQRYEELRKAYEVGCLSLERLRRPFIVSAEVPHTDVWTFRATRPSKGRHPCQKPAAMMEHIVSASSRPGAVVFDPFMGSGATGLAAIKLGRRFIGMEMDPTYFKGASEKLTAAAAGSAP